jgi:hypothetical protein
VDETIEGRAGWEVAGRMYDQNGALIALFVRSPATTKDALAVVP